MEGPEEIIQAAEEIAGILESRGVGAVVIGAVGGSLPSSHHSRSEDRRVTGGDRDLLGFRR